MILASEANDFPFLIKKKKRWENLPVVYQGSIKKGDRERNKKLLNLKLKFAT